jgi:hypothetical protein
MGLGISNARGRLAILAAFFLLALTGCGASAPVLKSTDELGPAEGALVMINHSPINNVVLSFRKAGTLGGIHESGQFPAGVAMRMVRLPAGEYEVDGVIANGIRYRYQGHPFTIKPGVINYIGDSFLNMAGPFYGSIRFVDQQDRLDSYLAERFPDIVKRYRVEVAVRNTDRE